METSRLDTELPHEMARLDIKENAGCSAQNIMPESSATQSSLRNRKSLAPEPIKSTNRRVSTKKPRRHTLSETPNPKQIEALYLNKKIRTQSRPLETIYEEPRSSSSNSDPFIGNRKLKRLLTSQIGSHNTEEKIKNRREKIKKCFGNKTFLYRKKIPMNVFLKTMENLELDEAVHSEESDSMICEEIQ